MIFKRSIMTIVLLGILVGSLVASSDVWAARINSLLGESVVPPASTGTWNPLGDGVNRTVRAIAIVGTDVYVGGEFFNVGGNPTADYIARWDGSTWHAVGGGLNQSVETIAVSGSDIYVGGAFINAGGDPDADKIARWDGSSWHALADGLEQDYDTVNAIAVSGSDIYVGGEIGLVPGTLNQLANNILRWDGSSWHALGSGLKQELGVHASAVYSIGVSGSDVYVGGNFTNAGGDSSADYIARWDGSAWHSLGNGIFPYPSSVRAIAVDGSDVYVGGNFTNAGGNPDADYFARWDGSNWYGLGFGFSSLDAIEVDGTDIYVGYYGGGSTTKAIACYDGTTWHGLGYGLTITPSVWAIAANDTDVYVGGSFTETYDTGMVVNHIARWEKGSNLLVYNIYLPILSR